MTRMLEAYRAKPGILILNHHRIGDAKGSRFDRAVFSATVEQLDQQVSYLKRQFAVVGGEELDDLVSMRRPIKRLYIAITFDDGYYDNYTNAFPVLESHQCPGMFFLVPTYVGTNTIPWWDEIAYLVRNCQKASITLQVPAPKTFALEGDREDAIYRVLQHYKRADNESPEDFMVQLRQATECELPETGRRFLDWEEAREMQRAGMSIGSHTWTHRILGQMKPEAQQKELVQSRDVIEKELGCDVTTLAYPVGGRTAFSEITEELARAAGYRLCFSFYGGVNTAENLRQTNVLRMSVEPEPLLFRNQMLFMTRFGRLPY